MLLHVGFEKPTPEIMTQWQAWFESVKSLTVDHIGLGPTARKITQNGTENIPFDLNAITGCSIIRAKDMDEAERLVQGNPFITSIHIYEIREQ